MLTLISNFNNFKPKQNQVAEVTDLRRLATAVIISDIINMRGNMSYGYTDAIAQEIIKKLTIKKDELILVINDLSLEMYNALTNIGYTNIILAYGKWNKDATPSNDETVYNIMKAYIKANFKEKLNVIELKEIFSMKYKVNAIIANPPYGAIGANITKKIIDSLDFEEYVNLLPANDYKRNKEKNLFNYQSDMCSIRDGFADAAVTTHLAKIHKNKVNNMTLDEFERSQYIDRSLDKYFEENSSRKHYAIDAATYKPKLLDFETKFDLRKCLFIGKRYISDEHLPYTKDCAGYKVNIERTITAAELIAMSAKSEQANGNVGDFILTQFDTEAEQNNISNFLYSKDGYRFTAKILVGMNADSYCHVKKFLPKVDWTRSWTVEEILADYGYTADEIKEVMDDLVNFKGMED